MCFLPLGCLKFIVGVGAVLSIVISLGLLAVTIYANVEKKQIISNTGGQVVNDALVGLYLGAAVFMILGICGVYGAMRAKKKQKNSGNCFLFFYLLGVFVFLALFIGATIFFFIGPETIFKDDCAHGSKTTLVDELYNLSQKAKAQFCMSQNCPCYLNSTNQKSYLAQYFRNNSDKYHLTKNSSHKYYQPCMDAEAQKDSNTLLLGALEQLLQCGGWCQQDDIFTKYSKFYDINVCTQKQCLQNRKGCYQQFKNFLTGNGRLMGYACSIATLICLINVITVCCICFHPSKSRGGSNFYARMMEDD